MFIAKFKFKFNKLHERRKMKRLPAFTVIIALAVSNSYVKRIQITFIVYSIMHTK